MGVVIMRNDMIKVHLAGDSTMADKDPEIYPEMGWGQRIGDYFTDKVLFHNYARNGRSSRSFIDEGLLENIATKIKEKDFLFIQFGHNDQKDDINRRTEPFYTYQSYLSQYILIARKAGATPVLVTPVSRRKFDENAKIINTHSPYDEAMKALAHEMHIPLIDLCEKSKILLEKYGDEESKKLFLWVKPGEYAKYPEGRSDDTHFQARGAYEIAGLVVEGIKEVMRDTPLHGQLKVT
jgi:lysophospholipase L1-like esterase